MLYSAVAVVAVVAVVVLEVVCVVELQLMPVESFEREEPHDW